MSIKECPVDTSGEPAGVPLFEIHKMRKHPTALSENLTDDTNILMLVNLTPKRLASRGASSPKFAAGARMVAMVETINGPDPAPPGV